MGFDMKNINWLHKSRITIDQEHHSSVLHEIEIANLIRIRIMLVVLFIVEILFIILNDIPYLFQFSTRIIWQDSGYFVIHLLLLITSIAGFLIANKLIRLEEAKWKRSYRNFTSGILMIYLILISFLSNLDQSNIHNISSIYIANLLICGGIFMLRFTQSLITYITPTLCYMGTFLYLGYEGQVLYSNLINCSIFLFAVIIISTTLYNYQYESIAKNIILDQANNQLSFISNHDPLTGLLNRRCFMAELEKIQAENNEPAVVVLVDVDHFKIVNDTYGHPVGDIVLKEVSSVLMKYMKTEDLAVRWGGEEFLLFLYHNTM